jgi:hypothetical protein
VEAVMDRDERAREYRERVRLIREAKMKRRLIGAELVLVAIIVLLLFILEVSPA